MCDLCNPTKQKNAKEKSIFNAEKLERMADYYRKMARGDIKPHTKEAQQAGILAASIVRNLVDEWI